jgi:S1-C subfamily serine protease
MRRGLFICLVVVGLVYVGASSGAKPTVTENTWMQTRYGAEVSLRVRFKNVETATCVPDSNSASRVFGTVLYWHEFWCAGRTFGGRVYHLRFEATGQCDKCWTIDQVEGAAVSTLTVREFATPLTRSSSAPVSGDRPEQLFQAVASGMVYLSASCKTGDWSGSGFLVGPQTIVTALHVLRGGSGPPCTRVTASQQGTTRVVRLTNWDSYPTDDLAVAHLASPLSGFFFSIAGSTPSAGDAAIALGYSLGNPLSLNQGSDEGLISYRGVPTLEFDLLSAGGASGGPILNSAGDVIGLVQRAETSLHVGYTLSVDLPNIASRLCGAVASTSPNTLCHTAPPGLLPAINSTAKAAPTVAWPPKGYTRMSNSIYYKWTSSGACTTGSNGCWQVDVVDRFACPAGVVVIVSEESAKYVLGSVLNSIGSLPALTPAEVEIDADQNARSGAIDGINCLFEAQPSI